MKLNKFKKTIIEITSKPEKFLNIDSGEGFEKKIMSQFRKNTFAELMKDDPLTENIINMIKSRIQDKLGTEYLSLNDFINDEKMGRELNDRYIYQPFGSQDFPDFIIIEDNKIIAFETKFSESGKSVMWNSNFPKANAFYLLGSYTLKDVFFFSGDLVLDTELRIKMVKFFKELKIREEKFRKTINNADKNPMGFTVYVRKAYHNSKNGNNDIELDFVKLKNKSNIQEESIKKI